MIVECVGCKTHLRVAEEKIPAEGGLKMRCPKCRAVFRVRRPTSLSSAPAPAPSASATSLPEVKLSTPGSCFGSSSLRGGAAKVSSGAPGGTMLYGDHAPLEISIPPRHAAVMDEKNGNPDASNGAEVLPFQVSSSSRQGTAIFGGLSDLSPVSENAGADRQENVGQEEPVADDSSDDMVMSMLAGEEDFSGTDSSQLAVEDLFDDAGGDVTSAGSAFEQLFSQTSEPSGQGPVAAADDGIFGSSQHGRQTAIFGASGRPSLAISHEVTGAPEVQTSASREGADADDDERVALPDVPDVAISAGGEAGDDGDVVPLPEGNSAGAGDMAEDHDLDSAAEVSKIVSEIGQGEEMPSEESKPLDVASIPISIRSGVQKVSSEGEKGAGQASVAGSAENPDRDPSSELPGLKERIRASLPDMESLRRGLTPRTVAFSVVLLVVAAFGVAVSQSPWLQETIAIRIGDLGSRVSESLEEADPLSLVSYQSVLAQGKEGRKLLVFNCRVRNNVAAPVSPRLVRVDLRGEGGRILASTMAVLGAEFTAESLIQVSDAGSLRRLLQTEQGRTSPIPPGAERDVTVVFLYGGRSASEFVPSFRWDADVGEITDSDSDRDQ